jgi:transposase InsO family protein
VRALIRDMSTANPLWGAPRIHGELLKLGIAVSQSTAAKYLRRHPRPPSQTWRTLLTNHASQIMAADLFVVPTVTLRLLFVLVILAHDRRQIVHVAVTEHPTAAWTAQQLRNAFSEHDAPQYLLHDRDSVFADVATTIAGMNMQRVRTAPRSPWQNAYAERVIGSIRRELSLPRTSYVLRRLRLQAFSDSLQSCRPSSSRSFTPFASWSGRAPCCTWKSSLSDTSSPSSIDRGARVFASRRQTGGCGCGSRARGAAGGRPFTLSSRRL